VKVRVPAVDAICHFLGTDVAIDLETGLGLGTPEGGIPGHLAQGIRELAEDLVQIIPYPMRDSERNKVDPPPLSLGRLEGLLQLDPPPFCDLGRTDWARPDGAARHQAVIESLAVSMALVYLDRGETLTRDRGTKHHALRYPITRKEAIHN
jgi:hypothetical protein